MWNGGFNPINPAAGDTPEVAALRAEKEALDKEGRLLDESLSGQGDATRAVAAADSDTSYARQDLQGATNEARGRDRGLEDEKKKREEFINGQIKTLSDRLGVSEERVRGVWNLARFYQEYFDREIRAAIEQAWTELDAEQRAASDEIIRVLHAVFSKFSNTITETRTSSASASFNPERYFNRKEPPQNEAIRRYAEAGAQQREYDAEVGQLEKIKADKFNDEQVAEAEKKLATAESEKNAAEAKYESADARKKRVEAEFSAHRSRFSEIQKQMKDIENQIKAAEKAQSAVSPSETAIS